MSDSIHGDMRARADADTARMDWTASPSGTVWRKRVHLVGPPESGQVTSVVRYEPSSRFPAHDHPEGEEILVLEGVFSDEHGDWPAGTFLANPEGFRHAPFSVPGCRIFVKLRQFPGRERRHVAVDSGALPWQPAETPGAGFKPLYEQDGFEDAMRLERWEPGFEPSGVEYPRGVELFVLEGAYTDEVGRHASGAWTRLPAGTVHRPRSDEGCTLYVKRAGVPLLRSDRSPASG